MQSYQENDSLSKEGLIGTILVHLLLLLCFLFVTIKAIPQPKQNMTVIINAGAAKKGSGKVQPSSPTKSAAAAKKQKTKQQQTKTAESPSPKSPAPTSQQQLATAKDSKAPNIPQESVKKEDQKAKADSKKVKKDNKSDKNNKDKAKSKNEKASTKSSDIEKEADQTAEVPEIEEEVRTVDPNALYKPNRKRQASDSQGSTSSKEVADEGNVKGDPIESPTKDYIESSAMSSKGILYDLTGRELISMPDIIDKSQVQGIVVVKIKVDKRGDVVRATTDKGTTITNAKVRGLAEKAASEAKFNFAPNAPEIQVGTMTFSFKVQ